MTAVDIFCGAGGLTAGLEAAGVEVRAGYDVDGRCAWPYERNTRAAFVLQDVEKWRGRLRTMIGWLSIEAGNGKAARWRLAQMSGVSPAAQEALLYRGRAGAGVLGGLRRAWAGVLLAAARRIGRELEMLRHEMAELEPEDRDDRMEGDVAALAHALAEATEEIEQMARG